MDLTSKKIDELKEIAKNMGIKGIAKLKKNELIECIKNSEENDSEQINEKIEEISSEEMPKSEQKSGLMLQGDDNLVGGVLEVMEDGFGFLRGENYLSTPKDVYVSPTQIRRFNLKTGDKVTGIGRKPKEGEKFPALIFVQHVNDDTPHKAIRRKPFEYLVPIFPEERIKLENGSSDFAMRLVDLIAPIGKGQRGLIVAPPKAGKTTLLKNIANSIEIMELLKILASQGKGIITVLHDLPFAFEYSDSVAVMNGGKICTCADPDKVFCSHIADEVFGARLKREKCGEKYAYCYEKQ